MYTHNSSLSHYQNYFTAPSEIIDTATATPAIATVTVAAVVVSIDCPVANVASPCSLGLSAITAK